MARSIIVPMTTAVLSTIIHFGLIFITIFGILYEINRRADYKDDSRWFADSVVMLILQAIAIIVEITLLVSSICLIVGIKKDRLPYVTSWLYLTAAYLVVSFADFIGGYNALGFLFPIKLVVFILHLLMWYPIFIFWRDLRSRGNINAQGSGAKVDPAIYPQLGDVDYARQVPAEGQEKHHTYSPL